MISILFKTSLNISFSHEEIKSFTQIMLFLTIYYGLPNMPIKIKNCTIEVHCISSITFALENNCWDLKGIIVYGV